MDDWWETIERFAREKAEGQKQSAASKAIASAVIGRKVSLPQGIAAGAAGGEVSIPQWYTVDSYLGASYGARHYLIGPTPVFKAVPAYVLGPAKFLFGPVAVVATLAGVAVRRTILQPTEDESPLISIPFGLVTGGLERGPIVGSLLGVDVGPLAGELARPDGQQRALWQLWLDDVADAVDGTVLDFFDRRHQETVGGFASVLDLIPVWEADP